MFHVVFCILLLVIYCKLPQLDQVPRLGKKELICLLSFTCNYVVSVRRGFLFLLVLGKGCVFYCGTPWAFHILILPHLLLGEIIRDILCINSFYVQLKVCSVPSCKIRKICH